MSQKSWDVLRIVAGLYLAYLGVKSMMTAISDRPENMVFFLIMAVIFMITGAGYAIYAIRRVWAGRNEEPEAIEENEDFENSGEETAEDNEEDDSEEDDANEEEEE
ncbi:hypothetical protein GCM10008910_42490 [Faecalicatena orotica]|uniref:Uncharacterized protein n=1 Tax=Faecalicatena orotica TaxID=1544 RepID=A0A2Y9BK17_9FIRM|nr:hypothetical protein [Faecalicatena orotica]PWJ23211.1 hypothetical protein A8806_115148 [Faecalicatena orotica]SSA57948.1 hypothetical protein SAMN05216536_115148 [Faecalicatena orotica]